MWGWISLVAAVIFFALWCLTRRDNKKLEHEVITKEHCLMHLRLKSDRLNDIQDKVTIGPAACVVCGKFMRGGAECAIVLSPCREFQHVIHIHRKCLDSIIQKE